MSKQTQNQPLTKAQKQEKAKHLLVMFENLKNAEEDFKSSCRTIAREFEVTERMLKKAIELQHAKKLTQEVYNLEARADTLEELHDVFFGMYAESGND